MRTCLIDIPGLTLRLLDQLAELSPPPWFDALLDAGTSIIRPVQPAVTMTVQATYSTGKTPAEHGIIANGLPAFRLPALREHLDLSNFADYRCNVSFWEQSGKLLTAPRVWAGGGAHPETAAMLFVQSSMSDAADVVVTPKPQHTPDGKTIATCWSDPAELYPALREQLGEFPLHHYWGPLAGIKSTEWIAAASRLVWEQYPTDLHWVYIPQLDYDLQRLGPNDPRIAASLSEVLGLLTPLVEKVNADGDRVLIVSEYGMTPVHRSIAINTHLHKAGLLVVDDCGEVDYVESRAFAMVDHQVAHVYCNDATAVNEALVLLNAMPEVARVYAEGERAEVGLDCDRAGDLVAFSHEDAWFEYRWWDDPANAPEWANRIDIHRKPGYDPLEMFADPESLKARDPHAVRILADKPQLIKGSHGTLPADEKDWPVLIGHDEAPQRLNAIDIAGLL
jgi:predicted AlkP superfamily pyrophosphatase or phosphodiesterase